MLDIKEIPHSFFRLDQTRLELQLEVMYSGHLIQLPDHFRDDQKLKLVIKCTVQMPLEH